MLFTIISVGLGCVVAYPISKILDQKKRRITYWVAGVLGFFLVTVVMMAWANTLDQNVVGAPGASGWFFALGLGMMGWQLGRSQGKSGTHDSVRDQESRGGYDMSKFIRLAGIVLLVILTAGAVGIAKALVGEGAVPWYLPIIVAAVLGAIIGAIVHSKSSSKSETVSPTTESDSKNNPQKIPAQIWAVIGVVAGVILTVMLMSDMNEPLGGTPSRDYQAPSASLGNQGKSLTSADNSNSEDVLSVVNDLKLLAEQGDATAQNNLGRAYDNGEGVIQDYREALKWYHQAAEQGLATAQSNIGVLYANGEGVPQDYREALKWFRQAAEQGSAVAENNIGSMYLNGEGVPQDYREALKWYHQAAEQGDAIALANLGFVYTHGQGVSQDYLMAHMYFNLAAAQGDEGAAEERDLVAEYITPDEMVKAQQMATEWMQRHAL